MGRINIIVNEEIAVYPTELAPLEVGIAILAPKGPINTPTRINTEQELLDTFGTPNLATHPVLAALRTYCSLYSGITVVRVEGTDDKPASVALLGKYEESSEQVEATVCTFSGKSNSLDDNNLGVNIAKSTDGNSLVVRVYSAEDETTPVETIMDLPITPVEFINSVNDKSEYLVATPGDGTSRIAEVPVTASNLQLAGAVVSISTTADKVNDALSTFINPTIARLDRILAPGLVLDTTVVTKMIEIAEAKGHTLAIADYVDATADRVTTKTAVSGYDRSSHIAWYHPGAYMMLAQGTVRVPATMAVLFAHAGAAKSNLWTSPAGYDDNVLLKYVTKLQADLTPADQDALYKSSETETAINPLVFDAIDGYVVDGNRTAASPNSQRFLINVESLSNYIAYGVHQYSKKYMYKPNAEFTWDSWKLQTAKFMSNIQSSGGIESYSCAMGRDTMTQEEIDNGNLKGIIRYKPIKGIDEITIAVTITASV